MKKINEIYSPKKRDLKVIQFGEGNFLRAFIEWIFQTGNDKGIINTNFTVVQPLPLGRVKDLKEQDGLYTLYLEGIQDGESKQEIKRIDVLENFINPYEEYQDYLDLAKVDSYEFIISNTTEAGIMLNEQDKNYENTPTSYPGKLLALLVERYKFSHGDINKGYTIMPCELIDYNGTELKKVLNQLAKHWNLDDTFLNWLNNANEFCNTLVDRIVPGYPRNQIQEIVEQVGYTDNSVVKGEIFHLWVIEGSKKVQEKLPFDKIGLNVVYTDNITPYKQRKVRVLNGAHTAIVPVGYLSGIDFVKESVKDEQVGKFFNHVIFDEIIPASTYLLSEAELINFANDVISRFKNPFVRHELLSIALNTTTKYKTRILPTVLDYIKQKDELPKYLLFSLASMLVLFRGQRGEETFTINDDEKFLELYSKLWASYDGSKDSVYNIVEKFLGIKSHWEVDLNSFVGLTEMVTNYVYNIVTKGMAAALKEVL